MQRLGSRICISLLVYFLVSSAQAQHSGWGTAATVNGVEISNATLEKNFEEYQRDKNINIAAIRYPNRITLMRRNVLNQLVDQEVIWQQVQDSELVASDLELEEAMTQVRAQFESEAAFINRLRLEGYSLDSYREHVRQLSSTRNYFDSITAQVSVSEAERHEFYVSNPDKFQMPEVIRARHILLKLDPKATAATRDEVRNKAQHLLDRIRSGADFAILAQQESEDSSAAKGGDLGYFPRGQMVAPFEQAAFELQPGEISDIVESVFGLHIIRLEDHQEAQTVPEDIASERIDTYLLQAKSQVAIDQEVAALRAAATIKILAAL